MMNTALLIPISLCLGLGSVVLAANMNKAEPAKEMALIAEVVQELGASQLSSLTEISQAADPDKPDDSDPMFAARTSSAPAQTPTCLSVPKGCKRTQRLPRAGLRHIEGKGIGYGQGYTSLDFLIGPELDDRCFFPFLDLRGHIFDNGKLAANAGLGFRFLNTQRIWGANAYYDYRNSKGIHYNQVGAGLEFLGPVWDFRVNGYLPVGRTHTSWNHARFGRFQGNQLFVKQRQSFAMKGIDTEAGAHFNKTNDWDFYVGAGPYYFGGRGKNAWGGKARGSATYKDYLFLEASGSYDTVFKTLGQIQVGLSLPFGPKAYAKRKNGASNCCSTQALLEDRMIQPVVRQEIIVEDNRHRSEVAINPLTGLPYTVFFVDNESHSLGTFESPYSTFLDALNASSGGEIIYVFPGDGSTTGLNAGATPFQLKNSQQILGPGTEQIVATTLGSIIIPPQASMMPHFEANLQVSVINLADHNTLSGLHITANELDQASSGSIESGANNTYCIGTHFDSTSVTTTTDLVVTNCLLEAFNGADGILPDAIKGHVNISNNTISVDGFMDLNGSFYGLGIFINGSGALCEGTIANNTISSRLYNDNPPLAGTHYPQANVYPLAGIAFAALDNSTMNFDIIGNTVASCTYGITFSAKGGFFNNHNADFLNSRGNFNLISNSILDSREEGIYGEFHDASTVNVLVKNNFLMNVYGDDGIGLFMENDNGRPNSNGSFSVISNYVTGVIGNSGINIGGSSTSSTNLANITTLIQDNQITNSVSGISVAPFRNTSTQASVLSNTISNLKLGTGGGGTKSIGIFVGAENTSETNCTICLRFLNNQATTSEATQFQTSTDSTSSFSVEPISGNSPKPVWINPQQPTTPGLIHVDSCGS